MRHAYFLFMLCGLAAAQQLAIQGTVVDPSGRGVEHALVHCGPAIAHTDASGNFRFEGIDQCSATVEHAGFGRAELVLRAGKPETISLTIPEGRETVIVSALRKEITPEQAGVSASVITSADLAKRSQPFVHDVLRELPGVSVASFGRQGGSTQVFIRGAQRTGTLVLLDGVPVNDPGGEVNFGHFLSSDLDHVEMVRGPESALFGAAASAGVIQLFTKRGDPEARVPHGSLAYERGSFQTDRWMANLNGGSGSRLDYSATAEQFHTAGEFPNDLYRNTTGSANLGYRLSAATQLRAVLRGFDSTVGVPNRVGYGIYDFDANRANRDYVAGVRLEDLRGRSYFQKAFFNYHRLKDTFNDTIADGPYNIAALLRDVTDPVPRIYVEGLINVADVSSVVIPPGTRLRRPTPVRLTPAPSVSVTSRGSGGYQGIWNHDDGSVIFGYEYEREDGIISQRDVERDNHGTFAHMQQSFGNRVFLSGGARVEQNSTFGTFFTPRVSGSYRLFGSTFLRLGAGRGITEPSLLQNFAQESTYFGNPNLRPEKTTSFETGIVQQLWRGRIRNEVSAFRNSFRDLIVFVSQGPTSGTFENVDSAWARGLEFSSQGQVWRFVSLGGSYTRLWSRVVNSSSPTSLSTGIGQELQRRPRNSGSVNLSVAPGRWFLQCSAIFIGERQEPADPFGATRNRGYTYVSGGASWTVNPHLAPYIRIENLANERYAEVLGYSSLSRLIRGGLRVQW